MKYAVKFISRFRKDLRLAEIQGKDIDLLFRVVDFNRMKVSPTDTRPLPLRFWLK